MQCPVEIAEIILDIIRWGTLRIRLAGWDGDAARCALEADHIHNLASLLRHYNYARLKYYWGCERPTFMSKSEDQDLAPFDSLWQQLEPYMVDADRNGSSRESVAVQSK